MENGTIIKVKELTKDYDKETRALNDVNLQIKENEWTTIMGPSGSGKTTLLNIIGCLDTPTKGSIHINGTEVSKLSQKEMTRFRGENIGLVFQQYHLISHLNALENVMIAQYYVGIVDESSAKEVLEKVGLGHRLTHTPSKLSGGEQQRVCIARALINNPDIILADEPTGNLDTKNGEIVLNIFKELLNDGHTIVMITHNEEVAKIGDRIIKLVDGKIAEDYYIKNKKEAI